MHITALTRLATLALVSLSLAACGGGSGSDGKDGVSALVSTTVEAPGANCPVGGWRIQSGADKNRDGSLSSSEVQSVSYVCNGAAGANGQDGANGKTALTAMLPVSAGAECPAGGYRIDAGVDTNGNGLLDSAEVQHSSYVCNGVDGQDGANGQDGADGVSALIDTQAEAPGAQCPAGGVRILSGIDGNHNGLLDTTEVTRTSYLCNGEAGAAGQDASPLLLNSTQIASGTQCDAGGYRLDSGLDANHNGQLDSAEITSSFYVCNGVNGNDGATGSDGLSQLVSTEEEVPGANCVAGGLAVHTGTDTNRNGQLDADEVQDTSYVCNGSSDPSAQTFALQYTAEPGGSIVGSSVQVVALGENGKPVTAVPDEGFYFTTWSDGLASASRTDNTIQSNLTVKAGFAQYQYTLAYTAGSNGSVSGIVGQTVFYGSDGTAVTAVPATGYHFVQWSDGSTLNPRADLAVKHDLAVSASFALNQYTLTYQADANGSIMGNASQQVIYGGDGAVVAAVPNNGYHFVQWSDGVTTTNRTDTNVQANVSVTAEFKADLSPPDDVQNTTSDGSLVLSWQAMPNVDGYNIYYAKASGVTPSNYASLPGGGVMTNASSPVTLGGLDGGEHYYFVITSIINGVESSVGDEISLLLPQTPWLKRLHQGSLQVELTSSTTATVNWNASAGASYNLYISKDPTTDLSQYASNGTRLMLNVTPPVNIDDLHINEPVYLALETNGKVTDWTSAEPRTWGVDGKVNAQVVGSDGTRYVGGDFTFAGMNTGGAAAFPADASVSSPHLLAMPEVDGVVNAVVSDGSGGWYIGGDFTRVGDQSRLRLAHIDGSGRVDGWNPGANATVRALAFYQGTVYAGGDFTAAGNATATVARNKLASFKADGSLTDWNPNANNKVYAMVVGNDTLYAGGDFTTLGGSSASVSRNGVAAFSLPTEALTTFNPGGSQQPGKFAVRALAVDTSRLYVGGDGFVYLSGNNCSSGNGNSYSKVVYGYPLQASGSSWTGTLQSQCASSAPSFSATTVLAVAGGYLWANGVNTGSLYRLDLTSGSVTYVNSLSYPSVPVDSIKSLVGLGNTLYVGGTFTAIASTPRHGLAAFTLSSNYPYATLLPWNPGAGVNDSNMAVNALATDGQSLFVGGNFHVAGGSERLRLAAFDDEGFLKNWNPGASGVVTALAANNSTIYAGGNFSLAGDGSASTARSSLAAFDETGNLLAWNPASGQVSALAAAGNAVYVGSAVSAFDTSGSPLWRQTTDGAVSALQVDGSLVYAGGSFTTAGGAAHNHLAAFDTSGNVAAWAGDTNGDVTSLAAANGVLYAAGNFTSVNSYGGTSTRNGLAAFGASGSLTTWNPGVSGGTANTLLFANGLIYAGGNFTSASDGSGSETRTGLAAFTTAGVLADWQPQTNGVINSLVADGNTLYAGGNFTSVTNGSGATNRAGLATFDADGNLLDK